MFDLRKDNTPLISLIYSIMYMTIYLIIWVPKDLFGQTWYFIEHIICLLEIFPIFPYIVTF